MHYFTGKNIPCLGIIALCAFPVSAELTEGTQTLSGTVQLQCWQYGTKIIDERGLRQSTSPSLGEPGVMSFQRGRDKQNAVLLIPTQTAICLIKKEREE